MKTGDLEALSSSLNKAKLESGDFVFYQGGSGSGKSGETYGHVALALNRNFVIHSTTFGGGNNYPNGGVHISKIGFRGSPTGYAR